MSLVLWRMMVNGNVNEIVLWYEAGDADQELSRTIGLIPKCLYEETS